MSHIIVTKIPAGEAPDDALEKAGKSEAAAWWWQHGYGLGLGERLMFGREFCDLVRE